MSNDEYKIILDEEIYEPTGRFQESGREVIYTRKTVAKRGKLTITTKSNEPSEEALRDFNKFLNRKAWEYVCKEVRQKDNRLED